MGNRQVFGNQEHYDNIVQKLQEVINNLESCFKKLQHFENPPSKVDTNSTFSLYIMREDWATCHSLINVVKSPKEEDETETHA